ncbi:MAG: alpha/beta hydrolase [Parvularculaceae bacterium]
MPGFRLKKSRSKFIALSALVLSACSGGGGGQDMAVSDMSDLTSTASGQTVLNDQGAGTTEPQADQPPAGKRYRDIVFAQVSVERAVVFGTGKRKFSADQQLAMDIHTPVGDTSTRRPVMILAFPGGFRFGARDEYDDLILIAEDFAKRGYVVASIDYRLFEIAPTSFVEVQIGIHQAVHDMRAAIRFFREDADGANRYGTDGVNIFVGGMSSGAIMAAVAGTFDQGDEVPEAVEKYLAAHGGIAGDSRGDTSYSSAVSGVLMISGAVLDLSWIDQNSAPIYAVHEEYDAIVPCRSDASISFWVSSKLSGACAVIPALRALNIPSQFFLLEGAQTHLALSAEELQKICNQAAVFFYTTVLHPAEQQDPLVDIKSPVK